MIILQHTLGILTQPNSEWQSIRGERHSALQIFMAHIPFLAFVPVLATFFGLSQVGWIGVSGEPFRLVEKSAAAFSCLLYFVILAAVFILAEFIYRLSAPYELSDSVGRQRSEAMALAVHVATPVILAGAVNISGSLELIALAAVVSLGFSIYLLREGIATLAGLPKERVFMYSMSVFTVGLVEALLLLAFAMIVWGLGIGPIYTA